MAKKQDTYHCTECGWTSTRWVGRCGECQAWGTVVERGAPKLREVSSSVPMSAAVPISQVTTDTAQRKLTTIAELDRVLGDGLVPGAVVLLAGEPGVGKSTLLLDVAAKWARSGETTLYISGEESASQVRLRAERTGAVDDALYLASENDLGTVLGHIEQVRPSLLVLDSVQTISTAESDGAPGGPNQVREVTAALGRVAKREAMAVIIVGHVTKDGSIAGPRTLEHLVDVVLTFEGDRHSGFRMVRATKNRFGPADEVGCFEMSETGIVEVPDPSGLFTTAHAEPVPGTCVTVTLEGRRPLLAEIQALVAPSPYQSSPRRTTHGLDGSRIAMVLAVLERKARLPLSAHDVYVSTVGGARVTDPSVDLAAAVAIASAALDRHYPKRLLALGEVGLAGDLRRVPGVERRLSEAARLGFELAIVPRGSRDVTVKVPRLGSLKVVEVDSLADALGLLDLRRQG
ncbi:MAG TPA: DNA repair protein RadA [Tessaracoccus flavescens]|uniref:DNA repair protein RadA n=1 Tax=Tessaracoccus flavescens TaxID=399497 RepID=A0A921ENK0_9ACTN|nr:DNA repair protein RadA [Tessaracoccus flavescens]